ncbi:hypothetical protein QYE76_066973 [Lolium multiflorum]|uniref:DUF7597 domain-containing protein n=1 Tax=Lolium multiflorum TaxID=4521 RepID=A0AAD8SDD2_LOLMU|nr:hypothetical protein QYE76_066973 [Lolium multiflorum]
MASPSWIWNVSYMTVQDLDNGVRNLHDGEIHIWSASKWITLFDDQGIPIIGKFMQPDIDEFKERSVIEFSEFHAFIDHCIHPTPDVIDETELDTAIDSSAVDSSALDLKGKSKASDPISAEINPKVPLPSADQTHPSKRWRITYSTHKDLDRGRMKAYDGSLSRSVKDDWITLLDAKGKITGCRYMESKDNFSVGAKLYFPMHVVRMGQPLHKTSNDTQECMAHASSTESASKEVVDSKYQDSPQMSHYSLSKILDYSPGIKVAKFCYSQFGRTVHPSNSSGHFTMVVSFGRASFKLDESAVDIDSHLEVVSLHGRDGSVPTQTAKRTQASTSDNPSPASLPSTPPLTPPSCHPPMANFEVDPTPWLPHGHQIIDGGPTRLPRTFYSPSVDPPRRHDNICVAELMPPPPGQLIPHWRQQDDALLERTICYVAFQSEAKVPRDIVFTKYASVGGVKESWTASCFILTAEFADELPHDEDQMPLNGNPHPMPGLLQPDLNNFVNPQFPEIGWDVQEQVQPPVHNHGVQHPLFEVEEEQDQAMDVEAQVQEQQQEEIPEQPVEQEIHQFNESAFLDTSSSEGSVNMLQAPQHLVINRIEVQFDVVDKKFLSFLHKQFPSYTSYLPDVMVGPLLPKDMVMDRIYKGLAPSLFMKAIPMALPTQKFAWLSGYRSLISGIPSYSEAPMAPCDMQFSVEPTDASEFVGGRTAVSKTRNKDPFTPRFTRSALKAQMHIQKQGMKKVSRRNSITAAVSLFTEEVDSSSWTDNSVRRCTRHMAKANGYKFESMPDKGTTRKKPKSSKPEQADKEEVVPFIPVSTLQNIGRQLQIPEEDITTEKLKVAPVDNKEKKSSNGL